MAHTKSCAEIPVNNTSRNNIKYHLSSGSLKEQTDMLKDMFKTQLKTLSSTTTERHPGACTTFVFLSVLTQ